MYDILIGLFSFILFVILTPGILISPPRKSSKRIVAVLHAILFASIMCLFMYFFTDRTIEKIQNYDSPVSSSLSPSCPHGQNWISGTNPKYGYCSTSTLSDVLSGTPPPSTSTPSSDVLASCPAGQNWISGSNKKYGYCSSSTVNDVIMDSPPSSSSLSVVPSTSCPSGQNWVSGSNPKYGYCSTSSTSTILSEMTPSTSSLFEIKETSLSTK